MLVSPVTFRTPGNLAKVVVTADELSGGRVEVGLGAGWHEDEHRRHGFPFPEIGERAEMLEETLEIVHGLWDEPDGWSFTGRHYAVEDALFRPKPGSLPGRDGRHPNILVGGQGTARSFRIAARYADEFNLSSTSPDGAAAKYAQLDDACRAAGREPSTLVHSVMAGVLIGRDEAEVKRRERDLMAAFGGADDESEAWFATRRPRWVLGTPDEAREVVRRFAAVGVERLMLQDFIPRDLDMIDLAAEVLFGLLGAPRGRPRPAGRLLDGDAAASSALQEVRRRRPEPADPSAPGRTGTRPARRAPRPAPARSAASRWRHRGLRPRAPRPWRRRGARPRRRRAGAIRRRTGPSRRAARRRA